MSETTPETAADHRPTHAYLYPHDLARIERGLAQLLPTGIGAVVAIDVLCGKLTGSQDDRPRAALREAQGHLRSGASLADAVAAVREFPPSFVDRVRGHADIQRVAG